MSLARDGVLVLIENGSATSPWMQWNGGRGNFAVAGTFGGATVKLQQLGPDGVTAIDVGSAVSFTANDTGNFELPACEIRAAVEGGAPAGLYAEVRKL